MTSNAAQPKTHCEKCKNELEEVGDAHVCSSNCTFCAECSSMMAFSCPNCGGELHLRTEKADNLSN